MKKAYIGQWFRCHAGLGKVLFKFDSWHHPERLKGNYQCVIFGETTLVTDMDPKEIKSLKFLDCPGYYNVIILRNSNV